MFLSREIFILSLGVLISWILMMIGKGFWEV